MHPYIQYQSAGARVAGMRRLARTRRRGRLLVRLAVALPLAAAGLGTAVLVSAPAQAAATTATFTYTGGEQTYAVPAGVTAVTVTAIGGHGGFGGGFAGAGAPGAVVTATVPLPAGTTTLYVEVGGTGDSGGFNGGGLSGGLGGVPGGGDGGGASDVRTTSTATVPGSALTTANDSRLVVAGGGGGGGSGVNGTGGCNNPGGDGGTAGDTTVTGPGNGGAGTTLCGQAYGGGDGGLGGTAGGDGGTGPGSFGCPGGSGSLGQGGQSLAFETSCGASFAGGGGGGYYGGGAGGDTFTGEADDDLVGGGGGGAGSSYWAPGATGTSMSENTTSAPAQVQITPVIPAVATSTSVASSEDPSVSGQQVTFTATVIAAQGTAAQGTATPAGTVQFSIDGSPAGGAVTLDGSGQATYTASALSATGGAGHTVTADYTPGSDDFTASSGSLLGGQQVGKAATAATLQSSANPSAAGQDVAFTATVSASPPGAGTPTGQVTFYADGAQIGSGTLYASGSATVQTSSLAAGPHTITAAYSGDTAYAGSVSAALPQRVVPDKADLRVKLSVPAKARDGASVTETVTLTSQGPATAGTVVTALTEPGGLTVTRAGGATVKGRVLTWRTASLAPGASLTFTVTTRVGPRAHGTVLVAARARSAIPDPDPGNNAVISRIRLG